MSPDHRRSPAHARLAAVAVAAALALAGCGGSGTATATDPAAAPSGPAAPTTAPTTQAPTAPPVDPARYLAGDDVALTPDGELVTAPGVVVLRRVPNPYGYQPPDHSLGLAYRLRGETTWALLDHTVEPDGTMGASLASDPAGKSFSRLEDWLADQVAINSDQRTPFRFVAFRGDAGERLRPLAGVEILQQSGDVDLGPTFAGPGDRTAVAEVEHAGRRWWVLARASSGGPPDYLPVAAAVGGPTLEAFLRYAREQYDGGAGLR